jgi:hypothetical protein
MESHTSQSRTMLQIPYSLQVTNSCVRAVVRVAKNSSASIFSYQTFDDIPTSAFRHAEAFASSGAVTVAIEEYKNWDVPAYPPLARLSYNS